MRRTYALKAAIGAAAMVVAPVPALAQDSEVAAQQERIGALSDTLRDPATQAQVADTLGALSQVLLNLKVAPFAEAMAQATGEPAPDIDPDAQVRDLAPEAEQLPEAIDRELPRAMDRMAGMGDAMQTLLPVLRDMATQFGRVIEESAVSVR